tara:strand:+ start:81 stop:395 length:315 start_codon:yes stop_codon:yes gene_type:complete
MEIRISTETIDSYGELTVHKFDTFRKARAYWKELFDDQVEKGGGYWISWDGIMKAYIGFTVPNNMSDKDAQEWQGAVTDYVTNPDIPTDAYVGLMHMFERHLDE